MNIPFEWYKVFYTAATLLNYTKAAEQLYVSQSAVSQTVKQLETALGTPLFYKSGRQILLTREGEMLMEYVAPAVSLLEKGESLLKDRKDLKKGSIRIGASDTLSRFLLVPFFKQFHERYPHITLTINNRPSPISSELVQKGDIDLAIVNYEPSLETQRLDVITLTKTENIFVATEAALDKFNLRGDKFSLKKISKLPLLTLEPKSTTRRILDRYLNEKKIKWQPEFEGGSVDLILEMAAIDLGVAFVPEMALTNWHEESLVRLPLTDKIPATPVCIVKHPHMPLSFAANTCLSELLEYFNVAIDK